MIWIVPSENEAAGAELEKAIRQNFNSLGT